MLEESAIWASMNSWFTPTVLFVLLNLMIATIAFTSIQKQNHNNKKNSDQNDPNDHRPNIAKSPSFLLHRLKSINFHTHYFTSQQPQNTSIYHKPNPDSDTLFNSEFDENDSNNSADFDHQAREEKVAEESSEQSMDEVYSQLTDSHFSRSKSDTEPVPVEFSNRLPARMRKSASSKSAFGRHFEEEIVETRRPETVREKGNNAKVTEGDEEVDAKADDFINRFKQQLKLQRLDSIIRYKNMIGRGGGPGGGK